MSDEDDADDVKDERRRYRESLCKGRDDAQGSLDQALMTLSGGALAIALGFVRTTEPALWRWTLIASWVMLAVSLVCVLLSFRTSYNSFNEALAQTDDQLDQERIYCEVPGGKHTTNTKRLNDGALWGFILGLAFLGTFMAKNLDRLGANDRDDKQASHATANPAGLGEEGQDAPATAPKAGEKVGAPHDVSADQSRPTATSSPTAEPRRIQEGKVPPPPPPKPTVSPKGRP